MQEDMLQYYSRNQFFLSQMGFWPYQSRMIKILLPFVFVSAEMSVLATQVLFLYDTWGDMSMTVEGIVNVIFLVGATLKLVNVVLNNKKFDIDLQHLLQLMDEHWQLFHSESEFHILRQYANIGHKITKLFRNNKIIVATCVFFAVYINIFVIMFMTIPLLPKVLDIIIPLNESRPSVFVIAGEWGVDKEKYYYPTSFSEPHIAYIKSILLHNYVAAIVSIRCMVNVDTMYIVCVLHSCSLFSAIG
ncbi:Odorant receptor 427, partial [Nylanderia fulva]